MNLKDKKIILEFKKKLPQKLQKHLKRMIVFGSRVGGNAQAHSDLDVAVLVDKKNINLEKEFDDFAYEVMWKYDFKPIISLKVFTESHFKAALNSGFSFYRHIQDEGISL